MEIILLERIEKLGKMGDIVKVKDGFARNYLLPQKKALRSNKANLEYFEKQKAELERINAAAKEAAVSVAASLKGLVVKIVRQASESGHLYGSVTARDVYDAIAESGHKIERRHVVLDQPFKDIGVYEVTIAPHPDVKEKIMVTIARSAEEAERHASEFFAAEAKAEAEKAEALEKEETEAKEAKSKATDEKATTTAEAEKAEAEDKPKKKSSAKAKKVADDSADDSAETSAPEEA